MLRGVRYWCGALAGCRRRVDAVRYRTEQGLSTAGRTTSHTVRVVIMGRLVSGFTRRRNGL